MESVFAFYNFVENPFVCIGMFRKIALLEVAFWEVAVEGWQTKGCHDIRNALLNKSLIKFFFGKLQACKLLPSALHAFSKFWKIPVITFTKMALAASLIIAAWFWENFQGCSPNYSERTLPWMFYGKFFNYCRSSYFLEILVDVCSAKLQQSVFWNAWWHLWMDE